MLCIFILYISILTHAPPSPPFLTFGARHSHCYGRLYACSPPGGTQCPPFTVCVLVINTTTTTTARTSCNFKWKRSLSIRDFHAPRAREERGRRARREHRGWKRKQESGTRVAGERFPLLPTAGEILMLYGNPHPLSESSLQDLTVTVKQKSICFLLTVTPPLLSELLLSSQDSRFSLFHSARNKGLNIGS